MLHFSAHEIICHLAFLSLSLSLVSSDSLTGNKDSNHWGGGEKQLSALLSVIYKCTLLFIAHPQLTRLTACCCAFNVWLLLLPPLGTGQICICQFVFTFLCSG